MQQYADALAGRYSDKWGKTLYFAAQNRHQSIELISYRVNGRELYGRADVREILKTLDVEAVSVSFDGERVSLKLSEKLQELLAAKE